MIFRTFTIEIYRKECVKRGICAKNEKERDFNLKVIPLTIKKRYM